MASAFGKIEMDLYPQLQKHLLDLDEIELIILKGHLLIEEQVIRLIKSQLFAPEKFKKVTLNFKNRIELLWCLLPMENGDDSLRRTILEINTIRNNIAHKLEVAELERKAGDWACKFLENTPKTIHTNKRTLKNTITKAFVVIISQLNGMATASETINKMRAEQGARHNAGKPAS